MGIEKKRLRYGEWLYRIITCGVVLLGTISRLFGRKQPWLRWQVVVLVFQVDSLSSLCDGIGMWKQFGARTVALSS